MDNKTVYCPQELLGELHELKESGFVFRGHSSSTYKLIPNAFRGDSQKKLSREYPVTQKEINAWKNGPVLKVMGQWSHNQLPSLFIRIRIFNYVIYLLQYNYYLRKYYSNLDNSFRSESDNELINRLGIRNLACEQTFIDFVSYLYPLILIRTSLEGEMLVKPNPPKEITDFDETFPQHYSFPSAALDWTLSFSIAIYFAIRNINTFSELKYFSICCYKQIIPEKSPIQIIEKDKLKQNDRAMAQEGLFTYFTEPCNFYLEKGFLPHIEEYRQDKIKPYFLVIKRNMSITKLTLNILLIILSRLD